MRTHIPTVAVALCVWLSAAFAAAPEPARNDEELLRRADRVMQEAERQHLVNRRMDSAIGDFRWIITDLLSNGLLKRGQGDQLKTAAEVLGTLNVENVPNAARHLEEARRRLEAMRPRLEAAGIEIDVIIRELERLLARATSTQATDKTCNHRRSVTDTIQG